jgi:signal transduction histidine kinase
VARRIGAGDYDVPVLSSSLDEVGVLSRALAASAAELRAAEHRRREFLSTVAHEIRTPITSIRGYAQTLSAAGVSAEERDEFVQTIHRNAVRVGQLVDDLLELEALQAQAAPALADDAITVEPVVRHVVQTLRGRANDIEARVVTDVADDLVVRGDADALERILLNLTDNALRYGGRGVTVTISARRHGNRVVVAVSDDGPGIPADQRTRIFERFYRAFPAGDRERRGSGLGLAIASELARSMRGTLVAGDAEPNGARFTVELPSC